jgi:hypothetical protein
MFGNNSMTPIGESFLYNPLTDVSPSSHYADTLPEPSSNSEDAGGTGTPYLDLFASAPQPSNRRAFSKEEEPPGEPLPTEPIEAEIAGAATEPLKTTYSGRCYQRFCETEHSGVAKAFVRAATAVGYIFEVAFASLFSLSLTAGMNTALSIKDLQERSVYKLPPASHLSSLLNTGKAEQDREITNLALRVTDVAGGAALDLKKRLQVLDEALNDIRDAFTAKGAEEATRHFELLVEIEAYRFAQDVRGDKSMVDWLETLQEVVGNDVFLETAGKLVTQVPRKELLYALIVGKAHERFGSPYKDCIFGGESPQVGHIDESLRAAQHLTAILADPEKRKKKPGVKEAYEPCNELVEALQSGQKVGLLPEIEKNPKVLFALAKATAKSALVAELTCEEDAISVISRTAAALASAKIVSEECWAGFVLDAIVAYYASLALHTSKSDECSPRVEVILSEFYNDPTNKALKKASGGSLLYVNKVATELEKESRLPPIDTAGIFECANKPQPLEPGDDEIFESGDKAQNLESADSVCSVVSQSPKCSAEKPTLEQDIDLAYQIVRDDQKNQIQAIKELRKLPTGSPLALEIMEQIDELREKIAKKKKEISQLEQRLNEGGPTKAKTDKEEALFERVILSTKDLKETVKKNHEEIERLIHRMRKEDPRVR